MPCTCTPDPVPTPGMGPVQPKPMAPPAPGMFGLAPAQPAPQPIAPKQKVMDSLLQRELAARGPMYYPALPGYAPKKTNFIGG